MNYRIRKNGGKIYLSSDIHLSYYCRDSIKGISAMARKNGMWNIITMKLCPGSMGIRHFIPLLFVASIFVLALLGILHPIFWMTLGVELGLYLLLDIVFSVKLSGSLRELFALMILFPIFHVTYGFGSVIGMVKLFSRELKNKGYVNRKI